MTSHSFPPLQNTSCVDDQGYSFPSLWHKWSLRFTVWYIAKPHKYNLLSLLQATLGVSGQDSEREALWDRAVCILVGQSHSETRLGSSNASTGPVDNVPP